MNRKRAITLIIILSFILSGILFINYNMTKPTKLNKIIASKYNAPANSTFDDQNFYNCVVDAYNKENSKSVSYTTSLSDSQLQTIKNISCNSKGITSTKGIEKLTNLTKLTVFENQLTTLDVSKNMALTVLNAQSNKLTTLDVSINTALEELYASDNQLTTLDVSKNTALTALNAGYNNLTTLDVSKNTALTALDARYNQLTTLDVSKNTALEWLYAGSNKLTTLDVSINTALTQLSASYNNLTTLDVSKNTALEWLYARGNNLTTLDVSKNTALEWLYASSNNITTLDVSKNTALEELDVDSNKLTTLDVSKNTALTKLVVSDNQLTTLNVNNNKKLTELDVSTNNITILDVSKNTALEELDVDSNKLTTLDVSKNLKLEDLNAAENNLLTLVLPKTKTLKNLNVSGNRLRSLNLSYYDLEKIDVSSNNLNAIIFSNEQTLKKINISDNNLTKLDLIGYSKLTLLDASYNNISDLTLPQKDSFAQKYLLEELNVSGNNLETLDLSNYSNLIKIISSSNSLTNFILPNTDTLKILDISFNNLKTLDLSNCDTNLIYLNAEHNELSSINLINKTMDSKLTKLETVILSYNLLKSFDLSNIPNVKYFIIRGNYIDNLTKTENKFIEKTDIDELNFYKRTINSDFPNYGFYCEVVNIYNNLHDDNINCRQKLTSEQLSKVYSFSAYLDSVYPGEQVYNAYDTPNVNNLDDLKQLPNLKVVSLSICHAEACYGFQTEAYGLIIKKIDLSYNKKIEKFNMEFDHLNTLNLSNQKWLTDEKLKSILAKGTVRRLILGNNPNLKNIDLSVSKHLMSLTFSSAMTNVTSLNVSNTGLGNLDLTNLPNLTNFNASNSSLESINGLSTLTNLQTLNLTNNRISSLDVSKLTKLETLMISGQRNLQNEKILSSLTLPSTNVLKDLRIGNNNLSSLDFISKCKNLETLYAYGSNKIDTLNLSSNTNLTNLYVYGSKITEIVLPKTGTLKTISTAGSQIKTLDLSYTPGLTTITIDSKVLETLNLSNIIELNKESLTTIVKSVPNIKSLSLGNNKSLTGISLLNDEQNSQLERIVVHTSSKDENDNLTWITINNYPKLKTMTLGNLRKLKGLGLSNNALTLISNLNTKSYLPSITNINLNKNSFKSLDVSNLTSLQTLKVNQQRDENKNKCFSSITLPKSNNLYQLEVSDNKLETIDLSGLSGLKQIDLSFNTYNLGTKIVKSGESFDITKALDSIKVNTNSIIKKEYNCAYLNDELVDNPKKITLTEPGTYKYEVNFDIYGETGGGVSGIYTVKVSDIDLDIKTDYKISDENKYIYTGLETDTNKIINKITLSDGYEKEIKDNKLIIKKNNSKVREYTIINIIESPSNEKNYNKYLSKDYIYTKISEFNKDNVRTNIENQEGITKEVVNTGNVYEFIISYKGEELKTYKILTIINNKKEKYEIGKYLYVTGEYNEGEIEVTNGTVEEEKNNLKIIYNDEEVDNIPELKINFGELSVSKDKIVLKEGITYEEFMKNITLINLTAKLYKGETLVTSGNIEEGMILKVSNQEGEIKKYTITDEFINVDELEIDEHGFVSKYDSGKTYQKIQDDIGTSGSVSFVDAEGKELENSDIIRTGSKVVISTEDESQEYTIVVYGDINGDGKITMSDLVKSANYLIDETIISEDCYKEAIDVTKDGNIRMSDIIKLSNILIGGNQ
jgi:Leucine-rich repeat (LRR) protein